MIKNDLGGSLRIEGHLSQIATEFEELARGVREGFCRSLGKTKGEELFEKCIENSKMSEEERELCAQKDIEAAKAQDPELAKEVDKFVEVLCAKIFGGAPITLAA